MCTGENCPMKESCYRHTAKASPHWQAYFVVPPINEKGECEMFWSRGGTTEIWTGEPVAMVQ